jgi:hypothetical protein
MTTEGNDRRGDEALLAAQLAYYRAVAPDYLDNGLDEPGADELVAAVEEHAPHGAVLELACGPGTCTPDWEPDQRYDGVFLGFWLSHVPGGRFDAFWQLVDRCLLPGGRVLLVDDAHRTDDELVEGAVSTTIQRRLRDGTPHRAVKVPHRAAALRSELARSGWDIAVHATRRPFYRGVGGRAGARPAA